MKAKNMLWGILLVFGCIAAGCGNSAGGSTESTDSTVSYKSRDAEGNRYTLVITEAGSRAYVPAAGDSYVLTAKDSGGAVLYTSSGTVQTYAKGVLVLKHPDNAVPFTVTIGNGTITAITGSIPTDDGDTVAAPTDLSADNNDSTDDEDSIGDRLYLPNQQIYDEETDTTADSLNGTINLPGGLGLITVTNGKFSLDLGAPNTGWEPIPEGVSTTDKSAQIFALQSLPVSDGEGNTHGITLENNAGKQIGFYLYATKNTVMTGTVPERIEQGETIPPIELDLNLKAGWNSVVMTYPGNEIDPVRQKTGIIGSSFKWNMGAGF